VLQLPLKLEITLEVLGVQGAAAQRFPDGAAGLLIMAAIRETAISSDFRDIRKSVIQAFFIAQDLYFTHAGGIDHRPEAG